MSRYSTLDADRAPVIVAVRGEHWARRARLADVLVCDAPDLDRAMGTCAELFHRYPGLSLVALCLPDNVIALGSRDLRLMVVRPTSACERCHGVPGTVAAVVTALHCWMSGEPADPHRRRARLAGPGRLLGRQRYRPKR